MFLELGSELWVRSEGRYDKQWGSGCGVTHCNYSPVQTHTHPTIFIAISGLLQSCQLYSATIFKIPYAQMIMVNAGQCFLYMSDMINGWP
jgi:hypothetical protein